MKAKYKMNTIRTTKVLYLLFILPIGLLTSCKKQEVESSLEDGKSIIIKDLAGDTQASMSEGVDGKQKRPFHIFLFRFKDQKQIWIKTKTDSSQWLKTSDWDIAFTGPYNSEVYVNDKNYRFNPGFEGPAESAVLKVDQGYEKVVLAPDDQEFNSSQITKVGWASTQGANGWFFYSLSNHLMQGIPNRTYVIRLPDGKYAKLQLLSVYKGNPPVVSDLNWPAPYLNFRYYVQNDGSKNLNTNN